MQRKLDEQVEEVSRFFFFPPKDTILSLPTPNPNFPKKPQIATSLTLLYGTVATQVSKVNTLIELAEVHGKFIGAWSEFLAKGAAATSTE